MMLSVGCSSIRNNNCYVRNTKDILKTEDETKEAKTATARIETISLGERPTIRATAEQWQEPNKVKIKEREMEAMKKEEWGLHPMVMAPEISEAKLSNDNNRDHAKGRTNWGMFMVESSGVSHGTDRMSCVWMREGMKKDLLPESTATSSSTTVLPAHAGLSSVADKGEKACDGMITVLSDMQGWVEEKSFSDIPAKEFPGDMIKHTISALPVVTQSKMKGSVAPDKIMKNHHVPCVSSCEIIQDNHHDSASSVTPNTEPQSVGIFLTACGRDVSNHTLCTPPSINAVMEYSETSPSSFKAPVIETTDVETSSPEVSQEWTSVRRGTKENFELTATQQSCFEKGKQSESNNGALLSQMICLEDKNRFYCQLLQSPSLTSPASTCPSTSSSGYDAASSSSTDIEKVAALPEVGAVTNASSNTTFPVRVGSQNFTSSRSSTTAESPGSLDSSLMTASLPDHLSTGQTTPMKFFPASNVERCHKRNVYSKTSFVSESNDATTHMRQKKALSLRQSAISDTRTCLPQGTPQQMVADVANDERLKLTLLSRASPTTTTTSPTEGGGDPKALGNSSTEHPVCSSGVVVPDESFPDDNAAIYSDETVASDTSSSYLHHSPTTGNLSLACGPLRSLVADDSSRPGTNTIIAFLENSVSLNKSIRTNIGGSEDVGINAMSASTTTPPPPQQQPLTDASASLWKDSTMMMKQHPYYAQNAVLDVQKEETAAKLAEEENCEQHPKRYRNNTSEEQTEDWRGFEHRGSALSSVSPRTPFEQMITHERTCVEESYTRREASSTNVDERLPKNMNNADTRRRDKSGTVLLQRADDFKSLVYEDNEGSCLGKNEGPMPSDCMVHFDNSSSTGSGLPTKANTSFESPQMTQHQAEASAVLEKFHHSQKQCSSSFSSSSLVQDSTTLQASKRLYIANGHSDLMSVSSSSTSVCRPADTFNGKTISEHTVGETSCFPSLKLGSSSTVQFPADSCSSVQSNVNSSTVERNTQKCDTRRGENALEGERPLDAILLAATPQHTPETSNEASNTTPVTRIQWDASTPRYIPLPLRTASVQQSSNTFTCDGVPHEGNDDEINKADVPPWIDGGGDRERCTLLSGTSKAVKDNTQDLNQINVNESTQDADTGYVYRRPGQAWYSSSNSSTSTSTSTLCDYKESSSTFKTTTTTANTTVAIKTKPTSLFQPLKVATRDTIDVQNKQARTVAAHSSAAAATAGGTLRRPQWSEEEDEVLQKFFEVFHLKWAAISAHLTARFGVPRTGKQCRERWCNHVNPAVKKGGWTPFEDNYILQRQREMGNRWAAIAKELPGRTENAVKNRFISLNNCRRPKRPALSSRTAVVVAATHRDTTSTMLDRSSKETGEGAATIYHGGPCVKNTNTIVSSQLPHAHVNSSRSNTDFGGIPEQQQGYYKSDEEAMRDQLQQDTISLGYTDVRGTAAAEGFVDGAHVADETYIARGVVPASGGDCSTLLPPSVRVEVEEKRGGPVTAVTAVERRKGIESLDRGNEGMSPQYGQRMQQVQYSPQDPVYVAPVLRDRRTTATETSTCDETAPADACLKEGTISYNCNEGLTQQTNLPLEADTLDPVVTPLVAESTGNTQQPQNEIRRIALDIPADTIGVNMREQQRKEFETAAVMCSSYVPTVDERGIRTTHKTFGESTRSQDMANTPTIVRSLADLQKQHRGNNNNNKRRALKNSAAVANMSYKCHAMAAGGEVPSENGTAPRCMPSDTFVHQSVCDNNCGDVRGCCGRGSSSPVTTLPSKDEASHLVERYSYSSRDTVTTPANSTTERFSTSLVKDQMQQEVVQRQYEHVLRERQASREQRRTTSADICLLDSPLEKRSRWWPSGPETNIQTPDASQLFSSRWGLSPPNPAVALTQACCDTERINIDCSIARQQGTQREALTTIQGSAGHPAVSSSTQPSTTDHVIAIRDEAKKHRTMQNEESIETANILRASGPSPTLTLPQLHQGTYTQHLQTHQQELETVSQQIDIHQHCHVQRRCQETYRSLGGSISCEDTPTDDRMARQQDNHFSPMIVEQQSDALRRSNRAQEAWRECRSLQTTAKATPQDTRASKTAAVLAVAAAETEYVGPCCRILPEGRVM